MGGSEALLENLALVLVVAATVTVLFRLVRLPAVLGYLLAGLIVGPHVPIPLVVDPASVRTLAELGVILVMFAIGLHVSVRRLVRLLPTAGLTTVIQVAGMLSLGFAVGQAFGWTRIEALFLGATLAISSTMVASRALDAERADGDTRRLVLGILVIQDLLAILLLAVLGTFRRGGGGGGGSEVVARALELGGFVLVAIVVGMLLVPRVIRAIARLGSDETLLVAVVGLAFALALLAHQLGFSVALGAFLAGSLVAESGRGETVERLIAPLRDLFAAIFFVAVGMMVDPRVIASEWLAVVVLVAVVVVGMTTLVALGTFLAGNALRVSLRTGLSLAQIGEFSFLVAGLGIATGAVRAPLLAIVVAVAVATSFTTTLLAGRATQLARALEARLPSRVQTFAALYVHWREELRLRPPRGRAAARMRRLLVIGAIDALAVAGVAVAVVFVRSRHGDELSTLLALEPRAVAALILVAGVVTATPFAIGAVRVAGAIGGLLAGRVLPPVREGELDLGRAPRRALVLSFRLLATLLIGLPLLALAQTVVPIWVAASVLGAILLVHGLKFWRGALDLEQHVVAGAQLIVEVLARQASPAEDARALDAVGERLPGLGHLTAVRLEPGAGAIGKTLVELDLRGQTGATVLAIARAEGAVIAPTGEEPLCAGDVLTLTGAAHAVTQARALLLGERDTLLAVSPGDHTAESA